MGGSKSQYVQAKIPADIAGIRSYLGTYLQNGLTNGYSGMLNAPNNPWSQMTGNMLAGMYSAGQPQGLAANSQFLSRALGQSSSPAMFNPIPQTMNWQWPNYKSDVGTRSGTTGTTETKQQTWLITNPKGSRYTTDPKEVAAAQAEGNPFTFVLLVGNDGKLSRV